MTSTPESTAGRARIAEIRASLSHPIIDADGHLLESVTLLLEYVSKLGGTRAAEGVAAALPQLFTGAGSIEEGIPRGPWWPSRTDALYQATVMVPELWAERSAELGLDFTILYPSLGLGLCSIAAEEIRRPAVRALNQMVADLCRDHARVLTPVATIPMHTPEEAIEELTFAVQQLGLKVAMIPPAVGRPLAAHPELFPAYCHADRFGIDSAYDYDPVWQAFVDLAVAVTAHGAVGLSTLPGGRGSPSNYSYNHLLGHGYLQSELCRSLVYGGVPSRFPRLHFAFLEGGAGWAISLLGGLVEHWEKRGPKGLANYDPSNLDLAELGRLLERYGLPPDPPVMVTDTQPWVRDEFEASGIRSEADIARIFGEQFFFGCESDDYTVHRALDGPGNRLGVTLRPLFSSDIGHWDVPDVFAPVPNSYQLLERGLLSAEAYRQFVFELPAKLHLGMNPDFFEGTAVEQATRSLG